MMILIIRFSCPPTIHFKFITKCDKCYYRVRQDGCFVSFSFSKQTANRFQGFRREGCEGLSSWVKNAHANVQGKGLNDLK